jgi:hypothetical protein
MEHYIQTDANGLIIGGYSTAFRVPQPEDTLINADGGRKFMLNGKTNPPLRNEFGFPVYKWVPVKRADGPQVAKDGTVLKDGDIVDITDNNFKDLVVVDSFAAVDSGAPTDHQYYTYDGTDWVVDQAGLDEEDLQISQAQLPNYLFELFDHIINKTDLPQEVLDLVEDVKTKKAK